MLMKLLSPGFFRWRFADRFSKGSRTVIAALLVIMVACLAPTVAQAGLIQIEIGMPDVSVNFNGIPNTSIGPHYFRFLVDEAATDLEPHDQMGAFQTISATLTASSLGLSGVVILNQTYLFTNPYSGQLALRYDSPTRFYGQFSAYTFDAGSYMSDPNDLSTINKSFTSSNSATWGGQWRTDIGAALPLRLASGDFFGGGIDRVIKGDTVSISSVSTAAPEIHPATGSSAISLVAGVLAMLEQRRRRGLKAVLAG